MKRRLLRSGFISVAMFVQDPTYIHEGAADVLIGGSAADCVAGRASLAPMGKEQEGVDVNARNAYAMVQGARSDQSSGREPELLRRVFSNKARRTCEQLPSQVPSADTNQSTCTRQSSSQVCDTNQRARTSSTDGRSVHY